MQNSPHLIIFIRFPVPGEAKTRLIPELGAEGAAELQRQMTEYTVAQARKTGARVEIRWTGGTEHRMRTWLGDDLNYAEQGDGDLGERMARAFQNHFCAGAQRVILIGCDCPANHWENICKGFDCLERDPCVIGPATDGGYYLIGLTRPMPELFRGVEWGGPAVCQQTLAAASCRPVLLTQLDDVDLPGDVPPKISVVIPTFNEEVHISKTIRKAHAGLRVECIVADGGSEDRTEMLSRQQRAQFLRCDPGRAAQQNTGAAAASGDILLFLHADTELPDHWDLMIRTALKDPAVALGAFRFQIKERLRGIRTVEWGANVRSTFFRMPYGDQGLFIRRDLFVRIGGFPDQPILEDVGLVRRVRRLGRVMTLDAPVLTSGRRWQRLGVFRTTLRNQLILLGAPLGVSAQRLRSFYR